MWTVRGQFSPRSLQVELVRNSYGHRLLFAPGEGLKAEQPPLPE